MRPKRRSAASTIRSAVARWVRSAATVTISASSDGSIARALATTAQPSPRYPATSPAPTPREPPVMTATLRVMTRPARRAREQGKRTSASQALLTRPEECVPLRSGLGRPVAPVKSLAGYPGRQLRAGGDGQAAGRARPAVLPAARTGTRGNEGRVHRQAVHRLRPRGGRQPDRVLLAGQHRGQQRPRVIV